MSGRTKAILTGLLLLAGAALAVAQSQAPALGDVARQERAKPKAQAAKTYTNEDIPSVTLPKDSATDKKDGDKAASADAKDSTTDKKDAEKEPVSRDKEAAAWKDKISGQKAKVADLEREINLMDREYKMRAAVFYSDAGARLRDDKKWADEERKYKDDLATKQKALAEA